MADISENCTVFNSQVKPCKIITDVTLFAEVKHLLSAVQFVIVPHRHKLRRDVEVKFTKTSVVLLFDNSHAVIFKLVDIELTPGLCNGLIYLPNGELQLRVQASGQSLTDVYRRHYERHQQHLVATISQNYKNCSCAFCHQMVFDQSKEFKRVLPLPSDDWSDLSDTWFCHQSGCGHHVNGAMPVFSPSVQQRATDCLVSDLHFLVHVSFIDPDKVTVIKSRSLMCCRCRAYLGVTSTPKHSGKKKHLGELSDQKDIVKIYWHMVKFDKRQMYHCGSPSSHRMCGDLEHQLARYLIDQSHSFTCFRFLLQSRENGLERLSSLVWLLDTDGVMYQSRTHTHGDVCRGRPAESASDSLTDSPTDTHTVQVHCKRIIKLLYQVSFKAYPNHDRKALFTTWHCDQTVTLLDLPYTLHAALVHTLLHNTAQLPQSLRFLNAFHVGHLHKDQSAS